MIRIRNAFSLVLWCSFVSTLAAQDRPPQALREATVDLSPLKDWGTRRYELRTAAWSAPTTRPATLPVSLGTLTLQNVPDPSGYTLHDTADLLGIRISLDLHCAADSLLSLAGVDREVRRNNRLQSDSLKVDNGKLEDPANPINAHDFPADTLTLHAYLRIVTLLPREKGKVYTVPEVADLLDLSAVSKKEKDAGWTLTCAGDEPTDVAGKMTPCTKFVLAGGMSKGPFVAYVNADGALVKFADRDAVFVLVGE